MTSKTARKIEASNNSSFRPGRRARVAFVSMDPAGEPMRWATAEVESYGGCSRKIWICDDGKVIPNSAAVVRY